MSIFTTKRKKKYLREHRQKDSTASLKIAKTVSARQRVFTTIGEIVGHQTILHQELKVDNLALTH